MGNETKDVFLDSSFFKALVDVHDDFNPPASDLWSRFRESGIKLITSNFILDETLTLIRKRCGLVVALEFRDRLSQGFKKMRIARIGLIDETEAWSWFEKDWSDPSFTDCTSFALMRRLGLERVATFDKHFARAGFKIEK